MKNIINLLVLPLFLFGASLHGEEAKRSYRILFPDRSADAPTTLHLFDGTTSRPVEVPGMNFSPVYELPAGALTLSALLNPIEDPEKLPPGAPSVVIPETTTDFYLLVFRDPENAVTPVRLRIVDAGAQKLQPGQMLWLNLTTHLVEGTLGSEKIKVGPDGMCLVSPPRSDAGQYDVSLSFRREDSEAALSLCETRWTHQPSVRQLALIYQQNPKSRRPTVVAYPDFRPNHDGDAAP